MAAPGRLTLWLLMKNLGQKLIHVGIDIEYAGYEWIGYKIANFGAWMRNFGHDSILKGKF